MASEFQYIGPSMRRSLLLFACAFGNTIHARNLNSLFSFTPYLVFILEKRSLKNSRVVLALFYHDFNFIVAYIVMAKTRFVILSSDPLRLQMAWVSTFCLHVLWFISICSPPRIHALPLYSGSIYRGEYSGAVSSRLFRTSFSVRPFTLFFFRSSCLCSYLVFAGYRETRRCASRECRNKLIFT